MLVSLILSITGEVLDACCHSQLLDRIYIGQAHTANSLRIRTKGTGICNRITEIRIDINDWSKGPVGSHSSGFSAACLRHLRRHYLIIGSRNLHGGSYQRSFFHNTIAALFQVGCDQGIYFAAADDFSGGIHSILCRHDPVHESAGIHQIEYIIHCLFAVVFQQYTEKLSRFFFRAHARQCLMHPCNVVIA